MDYQKIIDDIQKQIIPLIGRGKVANYIPELEKIDPNKVGIALCDIDGNIYSAGDANESFSLQSITKVFTLSMAIDLLGEELWGRVGMEPSGHSFNSLIQLEQEEGVPRNPFINAGAIVLIDVIREFSKDPEEVILNFFKDISRDEDVRFDLDVARSEESCGFRNEALSFLMKDFGNIHGNVHEILELYYRCCSLEMSCEDLARSAYYLINKGVNLRGKRVLDEVSVKRVNSLMMTSGLYNNVGEFAYRVGLPAKSGVGGGIIGVLPGEFTLAVWSPELNEAGNSVLGMKAMELFTTKTVKSIF